MATPVLAPPPLPPPPSDPGFGERLATARGRGFTDDQILDHLTQDKELGGRIAQARATIDPTTGQPKFTPQQILGRIQEVSESPGIAPPPVQPQTQSLTDFASHETGFDQTHSFAPEFDKQVMSNLLPWNVIKSIALLPSTGYAQDSATRGAILEQAKKDIENGNYGSAAVHALDGIVPFFGPMVNEFGQAVQSKDPGRIGRAAGNFASLKAVPEAYGGAFRLAGPPTAEAFSRAAPYVAPMSKEFAKGAFRGATEHGTASTLSGAALGGFLGKSVEGLGGGGLAALLLRSLYEGGRGATDAFKNVSRRQSLLNAGPLTPEQQAVINGTFALKDQAANGATGTDTGLPAPPGTPAPVTPPSLPSGRIPGSMETAPQPIPGQPQPPLWQGITDQPGLTPPPDYTPPAPIMSIKGELPSGRKVGGIQNQTEGTTETAPKSEPQTDKTGKPVKPSPQDITKDFIRRNNITPEMIHAMTDEQLANLAKTAKTAYDRDEYTKAAGGNPDKPTDNTPPAPPPPVKTLPPPPSDTPGAPGPHLGKEGEAVPTHILDRDNKVSNMVKYSQSTGKTAADLRAMSVDEQNKYIAAAYDFAKDNGLPIKGQYKKIDATRGSQAWRLTVEALERAERAKKNKP